MKTISKPGETVNCIGLKCEAIITSAEIRRGEAVYYNVVYYTATDRKTEFLHESEIEGYTTTQKQQIGFK